MIDLYKTENPKSIYGIDFEQVTLKGDFGKMILVGVVGESNEIEDKLLLAQTQTHKIGDLEAWFIPFQYANTTFVLVHGAASHRAKEWLHVVPALRSLRVNLLAFDCSETGSSHGDGYGITFGR
jgi:hypothetical protein